MILSLNEIEAEIKKAARGAGLPWGLAEEAAKAARWLASYGVDPMPPLLDVLGRRQGDQLSTQIRRKQNGQWRAASPICPIVFGAALCDHAHELLASSFLGGPVAQPILVVPFAARAARMIGHRLRLYTSGDAIAVSACGELMSDLGAFDRRDAADIGCDTETTGGAVKVRHPATTSANIEIADWSRIADFAQLTYVPATERSRREGAGAGMIDND